MKTLNSVKSQTKPAEIDDYTSSTTVFVRTNIKESVETDPVFKTSKTIYTYDEIQYTYPEWNKILTDGIKEEGLFMQEQIDITQLALSEILELVAPVMEINMVNEYEDKLKTIKRYSAIVMMYAGMIKRNLITIDKVPQAFKKDVLEYLEILNKE